MLRTRGRLQRVSILALAFAMLAFAVACSDDDDSGSASPTGASASVTSPPGSGSPTDESASVTASPGSGSQSQVLEVAAGQPQVLAPGSYRPAAFSPSASFTVPEGWTAVLTSDALVGLIYGANSDSNCLCILSPDVIADPVTTEDAPLPADITQWLQDHPKLDTTKASSLQINDIPARQMEATLSEGAGRIHLFEAGGTQYAVARGDKLHIIVVEHPSGPVVISLSAPADAFDAFFAAAEPVIASLTLAR